MPVGKYKHNKNQGFQKGNKLGENNKGKHWKIKGISHIRGTHREEIGLWKGDDVSYVGLHQWVSRWKGKPMICEMCGSDKKKKYEWANVDHKYRRILDDYIRMCTSCHRKYDYEKKIQN